MKSFKTKSRLITVIMALLSMLSMITVEQWQTILPTKYIVFAPMIVTAIAFLATQLSEEKRVTVAENRIIKQVEQSFPGKVDTNFQEEPMEVMEDGC